MLKKYLGCLAFVPVLATAGESGGVFETNYGAGLAYSDSRNSSSLRASGNVSVPVYKYVGSTLFINGISFITASAIAKQVAIFCITIPSELGKTPEGTSCPVNI